MTHIRAWMSSKFDQIRPRTPELAALERLKKSHRLIMGKTMLSYFLCYFLSDSFLYLQVTIAHIRAWMSSKFDQIRQRTTELAALERLKIVVTTLSCLLLIQSILNLWLMRKCMIFRKSSNFGQIEPLNLGLSALEHLKNTPIDL